MDESKPKRSIKMLSSNIGKFLKWYPKNACMELVELNNLDSRLKGKHVCVYIYLIYSFSLLLYSFFTIVLMLINIIGCAFYLGAWFFWEKCMSYIQQFNRMIGSLFIYLFRACNYFLLILNRSFFSWHSCCSPFTGRELGQSSSQLGWFGSLWK